MHDPVEAQTSKSTMTRITLTLLDLSDGLSGLEMTILKWSILQGSTPVNRLVPDSGCTLLKARVTQAIPTDCVDTVGEQQSRAIHGESEVRRRM
jgi:hypothetical protein